MPRSIPLARRIGWPLLAGGMIVLLASCSRSDGGNPLTTWDPAGKWAEAIDGISRPVFYVAGVVFVIVEFGVLAIAWRYRRRRSDVDGVDEPVQTHGNLRAEIAWTIIPAVILIALAVGNVKTLWDIERAQKNATSTITVTGQQWWWEFRYDVDRDGRVDIITANQAVIPVGETIRFLIRSNDVIHSFWIPALNGKRDAVPGKVRGWPLQADKPGIYQGQCTEYCGLSHAYMRMQVKALPRAQYDEWVKTQLEAPEEPTAGTEAAEGKNVFFAKCAQCHQVNGYTSTGEKAASAKPDPAYRGKDHPLISNNAPNLTHLMSRERFAGNMFPLYEKGADQSGPVPEGTPRTADLYAWLKDPPAKKPMAADYSRGMPNLNLSEQEISQLIAYLTSLK